MKVSFIIVFATTQRTQLTVKDETYPNDGELDRLIVQDTKNILRQIQSIPIDKEIILVDNTGDFPNEFNLPDLKVIEGIQNLFLKDKGIYFDWFEKIPSLTKKGNLKDFHANHTAFTSLAYQQGLEEAQGEYIIMQHNDTEYLFKYYSAESIIYDAINYIENKKLSYLTVDKKPPKQSSPKGIDYFADCYWFLCRRDFYDSNNIHIDWDLGDTNYLATATCVEKGLSYEHLPGFYEGKVIKDANNTAEWKDNLFKKYPELLPLSVNIHTFDNIPFLLHVKGGTAGGTITKKYAYDPSYSRR